MCFWPKTIGIDQPSWHVLFTIQAEQVEADSRQSAEKEEERIEIEEVLDITHSDTAGD